MKLYDKVFEGEARNETYLRRQEGRLRKAQELAGEGGPGGEGGETAPKRERLSREEYLKQRRERDQRTKEKLKFKSLYGRKTKKGQPIMKHRINHLLFKIKATMGTPN